MKVYISGAITKCLDYKARFNKAEANLIRLGHKIINPSEMKLPNSNSSWGDYMVVCLMMLKDADAIYMLKNYKESQGAMIELAFAERMNKIIIYETNEEGQEIVKWR